MLEIGFINEKGERCFYTQSQGSLKVGPNDQLKELEEWATEHLKAISVMEPSDIALATKAVYEQILGKIGELRNQ